MHSPPNLQGLVFKGNKRVGCKIYSRLIFNRPGRKVLSRGAFLWSNKCLAESFDPSADIKLKKWEIALTPEHFIRLRKTYQHGKQEYYSLHLNRLDSVNYLGTSDGGQLRFKAIADDIIVQTYDDPKGNIDSMATVLDIPVKSMSPERVDSLNEAIKYLRSKDITAHLPGR